MIARVHGLFSSAVPFLAAVCVTVTGCVGVDVTGEASLCGGYATGMRLTVVNDLAVLDDSRVVAWPYLVAEYREGRPRTHVKGLLLAGERVEVTRIELDRHPDVGVSIHPHARILTGIWEDMEVDLHYVSARLERIRSRYGWVTRLGPEPTIMVVDVSAP